MTPNTAAWFSTPNIAGVEMVARCGFSTVIFDVEHGAFDLNDLNGSVPFAKQLGLSVLVKALAPERAPIQQALDFGADGVVIPHVLNAEHARSVTQFAKLPPLGDRSLAGGRVMEYGGFDDDWSRRQDSATLCLPMIEHPGALDDLAEILALDTVDGVFVGPGDLFARRGSGGHTIASFEEATLRHIGRTSRSAGKKWMMPAWSEAEQRIAIEEGADTIGVIQEFSALRGAFEDALARFVTLSTNVGAR